MIKCNWLYWFLIFCLNEDGGHRSKTGYQSHTAKNEHWENQHHLRSREARSDRDTLRSLTTEINWMWLELEATKLGAKEEIAHIEAWNSGINAQLEKADWEVDKMCTWIDDGKRKQKQLSKKKKVKFHKAKKEMQAEIQSALPPNKRWRHQAMGKPSCLNWW